MDFVKKWLKRYFLFAAKTPFWLVVGLMLGVVAALMALAAAGILLFHLPEEILDTALIVLVSSLFLGLILYFITWIVRKACIAYKAYGQGVYVGFAGDGITVIAGNPLWVGLWFRRGEIDWCRIPRLDDNTFGIISKITEIVKADKARSKTRVSAIVWLSICLSSPEFDPQDLYRLMSGAINDVRRSLEVRFKLAANRSTEVKGVFTSLDPHNTLAFAQGLAAALKKVSLDELYLENVESVRITKVVVVATFGRTISQVTVPA